MKRVERADPSADGGLEERGTRTGLVADGTTVDPYVRSIVEAVVKKLAIVRVRLERVNAPAAYRHWSQCSAVVSSDIDHCLAVTVLGVLDEVSYDACLIDRHVIGSSVIDGCISLGRWRTLFPILDTIPKLGCSVPGQSTHQESGCVVDVLRLPVSDWVHLLTGMPMSWPSR